MIKSEMPDTNSVGLNRPGKRLRSTKEARKQYHYPHTGPQFVLGNRQGSYANLNVIGNGINMLEEE